MVVAGTLHGVGCGTAVQFIAVGLAVGYGCLGGIHGLFPLLAVISEIHQRRSVRVLEVRIKIRVAINKWRGGVKQ